MVKRVFRENGIYSSGILFFICGLEKTKLKTVQELDEYCRDRKKQEKIYSIPFRCFDVER